MWCKLITKVTRNRSREKGQEVGDRNWVHRTFFLLTFLLLLEKLKKTREEERQAPKSSSWTQTLVKNTISCRSHSNFFSSFSLFYYQKLFKENEKMKEIQSERERLVSLYPRRPLNTWRLFEPVLFFPPLVWKSEDRISSSQFYLSFLSLSILSLLLTLNSISNGVTLIRLLRSSVDLSSDQTSIPTTTGSFSPSLPSHSLYC